MADPKKTPAPGGVTPQAPTDAPKDATKAAPPAKDAAAPAADTKASAAKTPVDNAGDKTDPLPSLIDQYAHGKIDAAAVVSEISLDDPDRPAAVLTYDQKVQREFEDDNDYDGTWSEVVAAWIGGQITDAQYNELRTAFTPEGATTGEEDAAAATPAGDATQPQETAAPAPAKPASGVTPKPPAAN